MKLVAWIKKNKLASFLLVVVGYYLFSSLISVFFGTQMLSLDVPNSTTDFAQVPRDTPTMEMAGTSFSSSSYSKEYTPQADVESRLVIQESNLSLLVEDVVDTRDKILAHTNTNGGYMVNSATSNPQDAPTATVVIRIPSEKLQNTLDYFHNLSIKVVSENLTGHDVTDQYVDVDARIATHEKTKTKFENILESATRISDITDLTQQIIYTQNQIDSLKGQQDSLTKNAQMAKLTIYLSTDEMALPYTPSETFRPNVIFKLAVRSLIGFLRKFASLAIWIGVYSIIWVPAVAIYILIRRKKRKNVEKLPENSLSV